MSAETNVGLEKSLNFAVRIVKLYKYMTEEKKEYVLSKQLLKSGTSIGANLREANEAFSRKDFEAKIYISLKEAKETEYWLELLLLTDYITQAQYDSMINDCHELLRILASTTKTLRSQNPPTSNR